MPSNLSLSRLALVASSVLLLLTARPLHAIDAGDMDPQLPDSVILAAMRFQSFSQNTADKAAWEKRHAALIKEFEAELEKASETNLRAASSLRTLISDLKDAKFVDPKKRIKAPLAEYPMLSTGDRVLVNEDFHIKTPETRVLPYQFEIKQVPAKINVGLGGGSDDSGDGGLHYMLIDPIGRVIKRGFADTDDYIWVEHLSTRKGTWKFIIEDLDTDLKDKKSAGNRGAVEVLVKVEQ